MKRVLFAMCALLIMSSVATAAQIGMGDISFTNGGSKVILHWTANDDPGGGLTRYDVFIDDPLNAKLSYFLQGLGFTGTIKQDTAFGVIAVNDEVSATTFDGAGGGFTYVKATDSFFFTPFTANLVGTGITDNGPLEGLASRTYGITAGTGGGSALDYTQIAQIVASGDVAVAGAIGRAGLTHSGQGSMTSAPIPEPSTLVLLGLGMVGLVGIARRQRKSS